MLGYMKRLYGICQGTPTYISYSLKAVYPPQLKKIVNVRWTASDRVASILSQVVVSNSVRANSLVSLISMCLRMVYKLAGGREVVEFQLILLTNKAPTKPESGVYG